MHLLRPAGEIQEETVEPFFENGDWQHDPIYFEQIPALFERRQPTALGGLEIAGVVVCFIGTCFAKKIFDEVYERTLKRPIGVQLDKLFNKVEIPVDKIVEYRDVIYLEDIDLVVVIRAIASKDSGQAIQHQVMQAHRVAHSYIEQHGRQGAHPLSQDHWRVHSGRAGTLLNLGRDQAARSFPDQADRSPVKSLK